MTITPLVGLNQWYRAIIRLVVNLLQIISRSAICAPRPKQSQQDLLNGSVIPLFSVAEDLLTAGFRRSNQGEDQMAKHKVVIRDVSTMDVLTIDHVGPYMQIGKAYEALMGWLGQRNLVSPQIRMIGIFYDDPEVVPEAELRSKAGVVLPQKVEATAPVSVTHVLGGQYAVLRHKGPYADLAATYHWLYGEWLPKSGREAADAPAFEEYLNTPQDTAPADLLTEIYLPLA